MSNKKITLALAGLGGFGESYLRAIFAEGEHPATLVAGVDPQPQRCKLLGELQKRGIPIFSSLAEMLRASDAELVALASPLHLHAEQTCAALEAGRHVLCEKPMAATLADAMKMIAARDAAQRVLAIGYQWVATAGARRLKRDILDGRFGRPIRFRTRVYWPRGEGYYARARWAGRMRSDDGRPVFDSPVNNACAHYIHNMLHLLGETEGSADWPASVVAELYRANAIENYDTAVLRCRTKRGVDLLAVLSHATQREVHPSLEFVFEKAVVSSNSMAEPTIAKLASGETIDYGPQPSGENMEKLWQTADCVRSGGLPPCTAESAAAHTALMEAAQHSMTPVNFPAELVVEGEPPARRTYVRGLEGVLDECYEAFKLPHEMGVSWASRPREVIAPELGKL